MDVFHVTDQNGNKLTDESVLKYIEQRTDRVGLLSEMFAVLAELQCDVVEAKVWIHIGRIASLIYVKDCNIGTSIEDYQKINRLEARLRYVLQGDSDCKDRAKLLFDVVCNLTDMEYVVFHATINTRIDQAYLEFYIRHKDGTPISSEPERQHVIRQGVVERRSCVGVRLELFTEDRQGLLAEVVRTFRENGLNVIMADIATRGDLAANTVYVTDAIGYLLGLLTGFFIDSSGGDGVTHVVFCNVLQSWKLYTVPLVLELPSVYITFLAWGIARNEASQISNFLNCWPDCVLHDCLISDCRHQESEFYTLTLLRAEVRIGILDSMDKNRTIIR
ncbi:ACT domain-containing protein ACR8 [Trifolium repens]|nr:ACT domain-containing protein ACR8 [Trifolium repens]